MSVLVRGGPCWKVLRLMTRGIQIVLLALLLGPFAGCSQGEPATLSGEARYRNEPIADGGVQLIPIAGTPGLGAAAAIVNGHYQFPPQKKLLAGKYRVELDATRPTGRKIPASEFSDDPQVELVDEYEAYLPEHFNIESKLVVDVLPGANKRDFFLTDDEGEQP